MSMLSMLQIGIMVVICYLCLYSILNRICTCIEECTRFKSYNKYIENKNNASEGDKNNDEN